MKKEFRFNLTHLIVGLGLLVVSLALAGFTGSQVQAAVDAPAITNDPNSTTQRSLTKAVVVSAHLTATNGQGTSSSVSSLTNGAGAIVNADSTNLNAVYTIKNTSNTAQNINATTFLFPKYYANSTSTSQITVADSASRATFETNLPSSMKLTYAVDNGNFKSFTVDGWGQTLLSVYPNFKWSDLSEFRLDGTIPANASYTWTVPLTVVKADIYQLSGVAMVGATNQLGYTSGDGNVAFRLAQPLSNVVGQYTAVLADQLGVKYHQAPADIQALMPDATAADVSYHNFYTLAGASGDYNYSGGTVAINLPTTNIADLVKDKGYSLLLNEDGTPQSRYTYHDYGSSVNVAISGSTPTTNVVASTGRQLAPYVYITLRKVITAQNSTLVAGSKWDQTANFVSGLDDHDQPLTADQVTTTLTDPDGIVQNGKVVKAGTFKVTYSYQVAANYYDKNEPYVVSDTATVTVTPDPNQVTQPTTGGTSTTEPTKPVTPVVEDTTVTPTKKAEPVILAKTGATTTTKKVANTLPTTHFAKVSTTAAGKTAATTLPQTSENTQNWLFFIGLGMLLGGLLGFTLKKRLRVQN